jgi:hypothetical protein
MAINPVQFWIQLGEQWQKPWADAMTIWAKGGKRDDPRRNRRWRR